MLLFVTLQPEIVTLTLTQKKLFYFLKKNTFQFFLLKKAPLTIDDSEESEVIMLFSQRD